MLLTLKYTINNYYQTELINNNLTKKVIENNIDNKNFSAQFDNISKIQEEFTPWSVIFKTLSLNIKDDITASIIHLDRNKKEFTISGRAGKRESLLEMKKSLDNFDFLTNIDFPLKNILEKENIDFEIKADLIVENIRNNTPTEK